MRCRKLNVLRAVHSLKQYDYVLNHIIEDDQPLLQFPCVADPLPAVFRQPTK
jgi:hypothetical protein